MAEEDTEYEKYVRDIIEALLRAQGLETVKVEHDKQVQGTTRSHQIDVYWEYRIAGVLHRVIINCKNYKSTVEVTHVLTLGGVLADMPGVRGVIVTTVGFQKGALEYAQGHGIGLKIIRPPKDEDWYSCGQLRAVEFRFYFQTPELVDYHVNLNRAHIEANFPGDPDAFARGLERCAQDSVVRDLRTGSVENMNDLWNRAMRENPTMDGLEWRSMVQWEDAYFERPGEPRLRVDSIEFRWRIISGEPSIIRVQDDADAIVRDAIAGTLLFVGLDGTVSGDVEEEFGRRS